jgi:hypothetical protein
MKPLTSDLRRRMFTKNVQEPYLSRSSAKVSEAAKDWRWNGRKLRDRPCYSGTSVKGLTKCVISLVVPSYPRLPVSNIIRIRTSSVHPSRAMSRH